MKKNNLVIIVVFAMCVVICSATHSAGTYQSRFRYPLKAKEVVPSERTPIISSHVSSTNINANKQELEVSEFRHIYSLDMGILGDECPDGLTLKTSGSLRTCGKGSSGPGCDSVTIPTGGQSYQYVRGKLTGYQYASTDAFCRVSGTSASIDDPYVDGVSITHGQTPRKHIWTYAVGIQRYTEGYRKVSTCPGSGANSSVQPSFVGLNYFCASGNLDPDTWEAKVYDETPLWSNAKGSCTDCDENDLYFCVKLPEATTDDIEMRICTDQVTTDEDIRLETIDFYVK